VTVTVTPGTYVMERGGVRASGDWRRCSRADLSYTIRVPAGAPHTQSPYARVCAAAPAVPLGVVEKIVPPGLVP
jgi:hypothetical protein